jgi:hypothetical protein
MDMPGLAALMAMRPDQRGSAIEADDPLTMSALAGMRLDRAAEQSAGHQFACCFDFPRHALSLSACASC